MDFFNPRSLAEPKITMDNYREWAGSIASSYLCNGDDPSQSLSKFAQSEELTPHQIEVLAAEVNKTIHNQKYASVDNKYHAADFPLADAKSVIKDLQADGNEKVAFCPPAPIIKDRGPDAYEMFGVKPEAIDKTASVRNQVNAVNQKLAMAKQRSDDSLILSKYATEAAEKNFIKTARANIIDQHNSAERMKTLGVIDHFCKCAGMYDTAKIPLAKLAHVLMREGKVEPHHGQEAADYFMSKQADQTAPESMISEDLRAIVVNGNHPLYITLKTLRDNTSALDINKERGQLINDKSDILSQKIRAL